MESLKTLLNKHWATPRKFGIGFAVFSALGFLDATYLAAKHFFGVPITCGVFEGCETVTTSSYASIGPIPVALLGAIYYVMVFVATIAYLDTKREILLRFLAHFTILGFLASLWFVYLQVFVIGAVCIYCLGSAISSTVLFALGRIVIYSQRSNFEAKPFRG